MQIKDLKPSKKLSNLDRLRIYRDNVFGSRFQVLSDVFQAVKFYLGDELFENLAFHCIDQCSSTSECLEEHAAYFLTYLQSVKTEYPFIVELAKFEWEYEQLFSKKDVSQINQDAFATAIAQSPEKILFYMPASSFIIQSEQPLLSLWEMAVGQAEGASLGSCCLVAIRLGEEVYFHEINEEELRFLECIRRGETMAQICEKMEDVVTNVLPRAIEHCWLDRFSLSE